MVSGAHLFTKETAKIHGAKGGYNKAQHVIKFKDWVDTTGWEQLIKWAQSKRFNEAFPATKFIFEMAYGKPKEQISVESNTQVLIGLKEDSTLNEFARRFGLIARSQREIETSIVGDGAPAIPPETPAGPPV